MKIKIITFKSMLFMILGQYEKFTHIGTRVADKV